MSFESYNQSTSPETPRDKDFERREESAFEQAASRVAADGYRLMAENHDREGNDPKIYHTTEHPRAMERRAKPMIEVFRLTPEQRKIVEMAIAWHDTVIEYTPADPARVDAFITRHRGAREGDTPKGAAGNEAISAQLLEDSMTRFNQAAGADIFSENQIAAARLGIEFTYPDVMLGHDFKGIGFKDFPLYEQIAMQNPQVEQIVSVLEKEGIAKGVIFIQPHLDNALARGENVPPEALIVALADLGESGAESAETFMRGGNNELRELLGNLNSKETLHQVATGSGESVVDRAKLVTVFRNWIDSQPTFALGQMLRFEKNIYLMRRNAMIGAEQEAKLRTQFSHFQDNILAALKRRKELPAVYQKIKDTAGERDAFLYFVRQLGYQI